MSNHPSCTDSRYDSAISTWVLVTTLGYGKTNGEHGPLRFSTTLGRGGDGNLSTDAFPVSLARDWSGPSRLGTRTPRSRRISSIRKISEEVDVREVSRETRSGVVPPDWNQLTSTGSRSVIPTTEDSGSTFPDLIRVPRLPPRSGTGPWVTSPTSLGRLKECVGTPGGVCEG